MNKAGKKIIPYVGIMVMAACGIVATAWMGLLLSEDGINTGKPAGDEAVIQQHSGYRIKDEVTAFTLANVDGKKVSLADYAKGKGVIVVFTCNHCPFAKAYEDRIIALDKKFRPGGYPVVAINPTDAATYEEDSFEKMKQRASEKKYPFPYLVDADQQIAKKFGASKTPHLFVLQNTGGKFTVEYIGTVDDNPQDPSGVSKRYVEEAVNHLIAGKPVGTTSTKAIGCVIKWKDA